jgi:hypothetical protein
MKKVIIIILVFTNITFALSQNKSQYQYHDNIPTRYGIQTYVDLNITAIQNMVENFIVDTIDSYKINVDNLSLYQDHDSLENGRFYPEDEIVITNEENYYDYELAFVPEWKQKEFDYNTKFVKGAIIHEFIHLYIYQFIYKSLENNIPINREYVNFKIFPGIGSYYASEFIEEGICEYVVMKLREGIFSTYKTDCADVYSEDNLREFIQKQNTSQIKYQYSRAYVQRIFNNNTFRTALLVILTSRPPSYEELLCPDKYYLRIIKHAEELSIDDFRIDLINTKNANFK